MVSNRGSLTAAAATAAKKLEHAISAIADRVSRRYFTLLSVARSLGADDELLRGAA